jgi:hypothetical protein
MSTNRACHFLGWGGSDKILVYLLTGWLCGMAGARADDSFLKQELPVTWVFYRSNEELLQVLRSVVPRMLVLPVGMSIPEGMPAKKPLTNPTNAKVEKAGVGWPGSGARFGPVPEDKTPFTMRNYIDQATRFVGMTWSYDAARYAVVLDFPWHVKDARSNAELMEALGQTVRLENAKYVYYRTGDQKTDPWQAAFNALLSKPENYPKAWLMRWRVNEAVDHGLSEQPSVLLFSGKIPDESGAVHFLTVSVHTPTFISNLSSDEPVSYYLFSVAGKFEQGGLFYARNQWARLSVTLDADSRRLVLHNGRIRNDNIPEEYDQVFAVEKATLVHKMNLLNGKPPPVYNGQFDTDRFLLTVAGN